MGERKDPFIDALLGLAAATMRLRAALEELAPPPEAQAATADPASPAVLFLLGLIAARARVESLLEDAAPPTVPAPAPPPRVAAPQPGSILR